MYKQLTILATLLFCLVFAYAAPKNYVFNTVEKIGNGVLTGPESLVFDSQGNIYTGIADGTIRKINPTTGAVTFHAYVVPNLDPATRALCGTAVTYETVCGRPLGLALDAQENLYVADAYKGILKIPKNNPTQVQTVVDSYQGVPFKMCNSIYLTKDQKTLYFTDTTQQWTRMEFMKIVVANKPDGRLFKLNLQTGALSVEIDDIRFANGIAADEDETFLMVNECSDGKVRKYYIKGKKAGKNEVVTDVQGYNDNIKPDGEGNFYVSLFSFTSEEVKAIQTYPKLQELMINYVPQAASVSLMTPTGLIKKINSKGKIIEVIRSTNASVMSYIAEAEVHGDYMYLGSVLNSFLARVKLSDIKRQK